MGNIFSGSGGRRKLSWLVTAVNLFVFGLCASAFAQENETGLKRQQTAVSREWVMRAPGKLIAEGKNRKPTGVLQLLTYRLEEIVLPEPFEFEIRGQKIREESELRLTISMASFPTGTTVWIGDTFYEGVITKVKPLSETNELTVMFPGHTVFENGAVISVSRGTGCVQDSFTELPERLIVPAQYRRPPDVEYLKDIRMTLRVSPDLDPQTGQQYVIFVVTGPFSFPTATNAMMVAQVGKHKEFYAGVAMPKIRINHRTGEVVREEQKGQTIGFRMSMEEFNRAKDGDEILIKFNKCTSGGTFVGRLDKNRLGL